MAKGVAVLVVAMFLALVNVAQGQTLECGDVTLRLGEPEKDAVEQLNIAGYKYPAPITERAIIVFLGPGDLPSYHVSLPAEVCEVEFVQHKIIYVARHWTKDVKNEMDAIHNVVEALHAIVPVPGRATCDIFRFQKSSPTDEDMAVEITCGSHTVTIRSGTINGKRMYDIAENIGSM